jgi:hypothetical protein
MAATTMRGSEEPGFGLSPDGAGAPEFQVLFSRPLDGGRSDSRSNSFRWSGTGTLHVLERGLLIIAKRRFPMGFRVTDERFIPAFDICDVYREGNSVRVDIQGQSQRGAFFQFWTRDAATAGTIVRVLPTTRTVEYEGTPTGPVSASMAPSFPRRTRGPKVTPFGSPLSKAPQATFDHRTRGPKVTPFGSPLSKAPQAAHPGRLSIIERAQRATVPIALIVGLIAIASLITTDIVLRRNNAHIDAPRIATPVKSSSTTRAVNTVDEVHRATQAQVALALADMHRFDDRIDGLRAQFRMAFSALQSGELSQDDFIDGVDKWLIPQWRALYSELATAAPDDGSLNAVVRKHLIDAALYWTRGVADYATGLKDRSYGAVIAALDRMSEANEAQRQAWRVLNRAQAELPTEPDQPRQATSGTR